MPFQALIKDYKPGLTGYSGYFLPFLLPAIASRSGEAGGEERQKMLTLFGGN